MLQERYLHMESIYASDDYVKIWAKYDKATPLSIELEGHKGVFKIMLLTKNIIGEEDLFEAYTPYGYGGPVLVEGRKDTKFPFSEFLCELKNRNIVDVFIRFSPFLGNRKYFPSSIIELNRYTVSRNLKRASSNEIIKSFSKGTKWSIKKSLASEIRVSIISGKEVTDSDISSFYELYIQNMRNKGAEDYYFLSKQCIRNHFAYLGGNIDLFVAELNNKWIAASLFIKDDKMCHYHLSASNREHSKLYPVDRILFEAILLYANNGKEILHLGGGFSLSKDDLLFKFKKKFGDRINEFHIGKVIVNEKLYKEFRVKNGIEDSKYFLVNDAISRTKRS